MSLRHFPPYVKYNLCDCYLSYLPHLVPRRSRGTATVRLLARVAWRAARWWGIATLLRPARRATRRRSVAALLLLRRATVATLLRRRTTVTTLLRRATITTLRAAGISLLVLGVVRRVDGTKNKLEDPKIGGKVDRRVSTSHLGRLVLEVASAIDV
jgi:hypothetical protein